METSVDSSFIDSTAFERGVLEGHACVSKTPSASRLIQKYTSAQVEITQVEMSCKRGPALVMTEAIAPTGIR